MPRKAKSVAGVYQKNEGSDVWYIRYRLHGKLVRKKIGTHKQASDYLVKVRHIRASGDGTVPTTATEPARTASEAKEAVQGVMLGELCDLLLKHIQNPQHAKKYKDQANPPRRIGLIKKIFGKRIAASIKPYEISDWLETMDVAPATRNRYKTTFSAIYRYGKGRHKVQVNPARDVQSERVSSGIIRFLTGAEEDRLRSVLQANVEACGPTTPTLKERAQHHIYELDVSLGTGMRRGEQYKLRWPDVDFDSRKIIVRDAKSGKDREVMMIDDVFDSLTALKGLSLHRKRRSADKPNDSAPDVVFALGDPKKWFASALSKAKIGNYRWHDNRHTFCSRLAQSGATMKVIMDAAGHQSTQTSARYIHIDDTTMRKSMAVLNRNIK